MAAPTRYGELKPAELTRLIREVGVAVLPIGSLEWHGNHLPYGVAGFLAENFAERLAERVRGVLLPTLYAPMTTLPDKHSICVRSEVFRGIIFDHLNGLKSAGFRTVCIVSGHCAHGHLVELYEAATAFIGAELYVIAASPLEVIEDDSLLDHGGRWETAQMLSLNPELVDLSALPERLTPKSSGILGEDPRCAKAEEAKNLTDRALDVWVNWVEQPDIRAIERFYVRRIKSFSEYLETYAALSWEQAIRAWWEKKD
jgi:creatinine amidohydrolase